MRPRKEAAQRKRKSPCFQPWARSENQLCLELCDPRLTVWPFWSSGSSLKICIIIPTCLGDQRIIHQSLAESLVCWTYLKLFVSLSSRPFVETGGRRVLRGLELKLKMQNLTAWILLEQKCLPVVQMSPCRHGARRGCFSSVHCPACLLCGINVLRN